MKIYKQIFTVLAVFSILLSLLVILSSPRVDAATYQPGCYYTSQGVTGYQTAKCPNASPDDAIKYPGGKCWLTHVASSGQSPFTEFNCADGSATTGTSSVKPQENGAALNNGDPTEGQYKCGKNPDSEKVVKTGFDFGCRGDKFQGAVLNPILDILFAIFRFLSAGVGLLAIGSIIVAGIQYSASRGDPQATANSIKHITNTIIGLLLYLSMFALVNFLVPGGLFT